jgi:transposase-like protein
MKQNSVSPRHRRVARTDASQRAQLLTAFDRSGLSAADFARQHGVHYTTFSGWRQRRDRANASSAFVQVELAPPMPPSELVIEMGAARLRLVSVEQLPLAARLLQLLQEGRRC